MDWDTYVRLAQDYDMDDLFMVVESDFIGEYDEELAYQYIDQALGSISELGKDTLERYFDYKAFGRDLRMDLNAEEVNGKLILFN